ncbi:MAG: UDP-N-acetylglucosamine 2-epimerase [Promethearchaeota archaeon]
MSNKKKICVVTGIRAEYGPLKLLIEKIRSSKKLELSLFVTGMHLLKKYGNTVDIIKKDGIPITKIIEMYDENDSDDVSLGKAIGKAIINFTEALNELKPDLLLVAGDRFESLSAVIVASILSIPIAHIQGGDTSIGGQIDEQIRHSITKFAHIHFPATQKSYKRIKLMGEEEWRIHNVGAIALDMIYQEKLLDKKEICEKLKITPAEKMILCVQHPYSNEPEMAGKHMKLTLKVLKDLNLLTIIIYPNNDPGSLLIIEEIERNRNNSNFKIFKNLDRIDFLSLLKNVDLLIGNSSTGIIESPIFKLPVVNIGNRNIGRESGDNVIDVPHEYDKIKEAVVKGLSDDFKKICKKVKNPYGNGTASDQIVKILEDLEINKKLLVKKLTYEID